jgi:hypothetical protein
MEIPFGDKHFSNEKKKKIKNCFVLYFHFNLSLMTDKHEA